MGFENTARLGINLCHQHPLTSMQPFFILLETNFNLLTNIFCVFSANAFNLDMSKILLSVEKLKPILKIPQNFNKPEKNGIENIAGCEHLTLTLSKTVFYLHLCNI